jgi:hypothetical protein
VRVARSNSASPRAPSDQSMMPVTSDRGTGRGPRCRGCRRRLAEMAECRPRDSGEREHGRVPPKDLRGRDGRHRHGLDLLPVHHDRGDGRPTSPHLRRATARLTASLPTNLVHTIIRVRVISRSRSNDDPAASFGARVDDRQSSGRTATAGSRRVPEGVRPTSMRKLGNNLGWGVVSTRVRSWRRCEWQPSGLPMSRGA